MKSRIFLTLLSSLALLTGCATAPQMPVALSPTALPSAGDAHIGVMMGALPKVDTSFPGAGCLLCMAAASVANSSLTKHAQTLPSDDLLRVKGEVADVLRKKGQNVTVIEDAVKIAELPNASTQGPNLALKDFSALQKKYKLDKILVIDIVEVGISRSYSAYVPTSDPKGVVTGSAYLVDLKTNTYEWYLPLKQSKSANGAWDEAPAFPSLSNAYFQAIEGARDSLVQPFVN